MAGRGRPKGSTTKKSSDKEIKVNTKSQKDKKKKLDEEEEEEEEEQQGFVEKKIESKAESTAVTQVIKETTTLAKDIQTTKEVLGDIVYNAFFNLGLEPTEMIALLNEAINYMVEDYKKYADLKEEHEIAIGVLQNVLSEFDQKKLAVDLVKQYQTDCTINGITPDYEYVKRLMEGAIIG